MVSALTPVSVAWSVTPAQGSGAVVVGAAVASVEPPATVVTAAGAAVVGAVVVLSLRLQLARTPTNSTQASATRTRLIIPPDDCVMDVTLLDSVAHGASRRNDQLGDCEPPIEPDSLRSVVVRAA